MNQAWTIFVRAPLLFGAAIILAQTLPVLESRWLWFSDEVRYAEVYSNLIQGGHWVVLNLNGEAYPDKPPLFFLLIALLDLIPGADMPGVMWLASAVSAIFLLIAMRALADAVGMTHEGFAAGVLVQLCFIGMIILLHYVRMDLLFVAFMMAAQACFHRFYFNQEAPKYAYFGYVFSGLAILVKGPLGLVLPLIAVWVAALWAARARNIATLTTVFGLLVCLLVAATWALGIIAVEGWDFFWDQIIGQQVVARATETFHHSEPLSFYFILIPFLLLPWTGFAAALPWRRFLRWPARVWTNRKEIGPAGILAIGALAHFAFLSSLDGKVGVYLLPVLVQVAMVIGCLLATRPLPRGWVGVGLTTIVVGAGLIALAVMPIAAAYQTGALICGGFLIVLGGLTVLWRNKGEVLLLGYTAAMTVWSLLLAGILLPGLNESTSTRITAEYLGQYAQQGHLPVAYRTYPGIFSYYAGRDVVQINDATEMETLLATSRQIVIAGRQRHLAELDLTGFVLLDSREINGAGGVYQVMQGSRP